MAGVEASGKPVLVTGGAGYIGAHVCKALAGAGFLPIAFDNLVRGHAGAVRWGPLAVGDTLDRAALDDVLRIHRPAAVVHLAALAYVGESMADPGRYFRANVVGTLTLLEAMRDHGVRDLVFSSTCATYGVPAALPITEATPTAPINPYGASKLMAEQMIADFGAAHGLRWTVFRYFNAAGADPGGEAGESHDPEPHLVPLAIDAALGRRDAFTILGTDYPTPDGSCVRDFIHVSDIAEAHLLALAALAGGRSRGLYNLGSGTGHSVRAVLAEIERAPGRTIRRIEGQRRPGDPPLLVAVAAKAAAELGWRPRWSDLATIIDTAVAWHRR